MPQVTTGSRYIYWGYMASEVATILNEISERKEQKKVKTPLGILLDGEVFVSSVLKGGSGSEVSIAALDDYVIFVNALFECPNHPRKRSDILGLILNAKNLIVRLKKSEPLGKLRDEAELLAAVFSAIYRRAESEALREMKP